MDFQKEVIEASANQLVLVDFWAPWCGPCVILKPIIERVLETHFPDIQLVTINVDAETTLAVSEKVMGVPSLRLYKQGIQIAQHDGTMTEFELAQWVNSHLDD